MADPLISVIVPTHNRPELVVRAVRCALEQVYTNIEIIVIDDVGNAPEHELRKLSEKVQYLRIPETFWISENRNAGIRIAKGKYIALLDDDDLWYKEHLQALVPVMEQNPDIGLACGNGHVTHDLDCKNKEIIFPHLTKKMQGRLFSKTLWDCFMQPSLMLIRKDIFEKVGLFRDIRGEDLDIITKIAAISNIYYTPQLLGVYYRRLDISSASELCQSSLDKRLSILLPMQECLESLPALAKSNGITFTLKERFYLYLQRYYFDCYIVAVHYMYKNLHKRRELIRVIHKYPELTPITLLTPLCIFKKVRDLGLTMKKHTG